MIFQKLRDKAIVESKCGQNAVIERKLAPTSNITTHAVVTNLVQYSKGYKTCPDESLGNGHLKKRKRSVNNRKSNRKES